MIGQFFKRWYGDFSWEELKKFLLLAVIFACIIGVTWCFKPLKDAIFCATVGVKYQPSAKIITLFLILGLVMLYSKLADRFSKDKMFYILCTLYGLATLVFYWLLQHPEIGLANPNICSDRLIGWFWYAFVESFGSILVVTFWSFVADTTTPESAKRGYNILAMGGQVGGIIGPWVATWAQTVGSAVIVLGVAFVIFAIMGLVKLMMTTVNKSQLQGYETKAPAAAEQHPGIWEGFKLLLTQPYLCAIFGVIAIFGIITTIFEFQFQVEAFKLTGTADAMAHYMGWFGVAVNGVTLLNLVLGIGNITRKLGLTVSLVLMPVLILLCVLVVYWAQDLSPVWSLRAMFGAMVLSTSANYALGSPAKEQLYIPTSRDTKYKAKVWIEAFGHRSSRAAGSGINLLREFLPNSFMLASLLISVGLIGLWVWLAYYLGRTHQRAIKHDQIVC